MKNLAGRPTHEADVHVSFELARCRINSFRVPLDNGEVQTTFRGRIESNGLKITLRRAWRYWVADGLVPLCLARLLYADLVGREDIRVNGDCACPAPAMENVVWYHPDGKMVLRMRDKTQSEDALSTAPESRLAKLAVAILAEHHFSDDPASLGASGFIPVYHIDTELGLYVFSEILRAKPEVPFVVPSVNTKDA